MLFAKQVIAVLAIVLMAKAAPARGDEAKEVLVHEGPAFTSPDDRGGDLQFTKEFPVSPEIWQRQPDPGILNLSGPPIAAEKALELARASVPVGGQTDRTHVVKLELLSRDRKRPDGSMDKVYYYLIQMSVTGSEVHRVILMDGTVVNSRLRQPPKP